MAMGRWLEINIGPPDQGGTAEVSAVLWPEAERVRSRFRVTVTSWDRTRAARWIDAAALDEPGARQVGGRLFDALMVGALRDLATRAVADSGPIPLRIRAEGITAQMPWELLYDAEDMTFLCTSGGVGRAVPLDSNGGAAETAAARVTERRDTSDVTDGLTSARHVDLSDRSPHDTEGARTVVLTHTANGPTSAELAAVHAPALLATGVEAVIVIAVPDPADEHPALQALLDSLREGDAVDVAASMTAGAQGGGAAPTGLPVVVFAAAEETPPAARARTAWRRARSISARSWRTVAAIGGVVGLLMTLIGASDRFLPVLRGPPPMTGRFNIAVATFDAPEGNDRENADASAFAMEIASIIDARLTRDTAPLAGVQVRPPDEVGAVKGATPQQRAAAAANVAERINADIVVFGAFEPSTRSTTLRTELYLSELRLPQAEELAGIHTFGPPTRPYDVSRNLVDRDEMLAELAERAEHLAAFVVGIGHYRRFEYRQAYEHFAAAVEGEALTAGNGIEVLHVALANSLGEMGRYEEARAAYNDALIAAPEYARAHLGLGEVAFFTSFHDCGDRIDAAGLDEAQRHFDAARRARIRPPLAAVGERAAFGRGRIDACRTLAGIHGHAEAAHTALTQVVSAYEAEPQPARHVQELAAESHALLGLLAMPAASAAEPDDALTRALDRYQAAADLSVDPTRVALHRAMTGRIHALLGETDAAIAAYRAAQQDVTDARRRAGYRCAITTLESLETRDRAEVRASLDRCRTDAEDSAIPSE